jgi:Holliday junction resolvasome RuvABC endonuclease subunit
VIAGVDVATRNVAIVRLSEDGGARWDQLSTDPKVPALEAVRLLHRAALTYPWPAVVWIERPMGRHVRSVSDLSRVVGAVVAALPDRVSVSEVSPPEWKVGIGLKGNASKRDVWRWASVLIGSDPPDQDAADALAIAWACWLASKRATDARRA